MPDPCVFTHGPGGFRCCVLCYSERTTLQIERYRHGSMEISFTDASIVDDDEGTGLAVLDDGGVNNPGPSRLGDNPRPSSSGQYSSAEDIPGHDPRIKNWTFVENPLAPFIVIVSYLAFVVLGPRWMANKRAMELKSALVFYSFSMCAFNSYILYEMLNSGWKLTNLNLGCYPVDYSNSPDGLRMVNAVWMFYIAKYVELLDTVFFILRKKNNQVTFLHVFHHGVLPLFWWWGIKAVPGGFGTFHAFINCAVHVVMYLYYGIAALGPAYRKYIWWKRYVTVFQLTQFFIVTLHNSQFLFIECQYPWKYVAFIQGFTTIIAVLFLNFYIHTYLKKPQVDVKESQSKNGHVSNGYITNGIANGRAKAADVSNGVHESSRNHSNGQVVNGTGPTLRSSSHLRKTTLK